MKKIIYLFTMAMFLGGCATGTYTKYIHLCPQKAPSWGKTYLFNSWTYENGCNEGKVIVYPLELGFVEAGNDYLFIQIPNRDEGQLKTLNEKNPSISVYFQRMPRIESCDLSFISLEDETTLERIKPISAEIKKYGLTKNKYTTECIYSFPVDKNPKKSYKLYVSDEVFKCKIEPIPYKYEEGTYYHPREIM